MSAPKLKSCPFCGGCLEMVSILHYRHPKGKCVISGHVFPKGYIGQWNTRVAQPDPRDEVIARLVEALTLAANRLHSCAVDYETGSREFIVTSEWADEARAALAAAKAVLP